MTTALTIAEAQGLANTIIQARQMLPDHIKSPGEALAIMLTGQELGLPPMQALRQLHMVKGKVSLSAEAMLALAIKAGLRHQWVTTTADKAQLRLTRQGFEPYTHTYTMQDAKRAGNGGGMYSKYPAEMLRARCISGAIRAYCPDILSGTYTPQEMEEISAPRGSDTPDLDAFTASLGRLAYSQMSDEQQVQVDAYLQTPAGQAKYARWAESTGRTSRPALAPPPLEDDEPLDVEVEEEPAPARVERTDPPIDIPPPADDAGDMPDF